MSLLSLVGGLIGSSIPGLGPVLGGALGSGIGSLVGGGSPEDALKAAALGGLGGKFLGPGGSGFQNLLGVGPGAVATQAAKEGATSGIFSGLLNDPKKLSNVLTLGGLGLAGIGALKGPPDPLEQYAKLQEYLSEQWDKIKTDDAGYYTDPISYAYFDTQEELEDFQQRQRDRGVEGYDTQFAAAGGLIEGPGTGTSDDIPAMIYQDGQPVREAALSNGEVVLSLKDLANIGNGDAEMAGRIIGDAPNGTRGAAAAKLYRSMRA